MKTLKTLKTVLVGMLVVFGTVFVMGNTAPTCVPLEPEMEVLCLNASECAMLVPEVDCVGEWACEDGDCVFHCDEDPEPPVSECEWDGDCAPNQHCEIVDCWAPPCDGDGPCSLCCMPIGECIDDEPQECYEDADCGPGFVCEFLFDGIPLPSDDEFKGSAESGCIAYGVCVPEPEPEEVCYSSEECAPGQVCSVDLGDCLPFPGCEEGMACPAVCLGVCLDIPEPECFIDEDCPEGFICEYLDGPYPSYPCECDPDDDYCLMYDCMPLGQCVPVPDPQPGECESDADCGPNQACELIDCWDYDCGEDEYCGGVDCAPFGICIDLPEPQNPCMPTGCSGQLCAPFAIATTCEWLPHYACYQDGNCGAFGLNGACAWEHTPELSACLAATL